MLTVSDMVFLTAPLTRETFGMIGRREFSLMKEDAILVNLARGELVDEEALYLHLRDHGSFVACIDAWWIEPVRHGRFEMQFPFLDLPERHCVTPQFRCGRQRAHQWRQACSAQLRACIGGGKTFALDPARRASLAYWEA